MVWWLPISYPVYARFYENQNVHPCYCGQNIYIVFRCREFHRNYMSQRRANMLNMLLMGFFVYKNRLLFTACMLLSYTLDYIAFSVVVKKCKPLIRPFIRSLRICPKSVNTYIFALFIILCNVIIKPLLQMTTRRLSVIPIRHNSWLQTELDDTVTCYQLIITITISSNVIGA